MIDHVIVTIRSKENNFDIDMELPSKISIADLGPQLLENLKAIAPSQFRGKESIQMRFRDIALKSTETLESGCVFDGSIIEIV